MSEHPHGAWLRLAHRDLAGARMLATMQHDVGPRVAQYAVHAAENAFKAALVARGVRPRRTQHPQHLLQGVVDAGTPLGELADPCRRLGPYLHRNCDPTDEADATEAEARAAVDDAQQVVELTERVIAQLGPAPERSPRVARDVAAPPPAAAVVEAGLETPISTIVAAIVAAADPRRVIAVRQPRRRTR